MSKSRQLQSVGLNFSARCNAECEHCCVSSSPRNTTQLTDEQAIKIVDDAIQHPDVREIGLTGGEPLMRLDFALYLIARAVSGGLTVTCTSNGYWGFSPKRAEETIDRLEQAGLKELVISYDDFHSPFVTADRISNILRAGRNSSIKIFLNMAVSVDQDSIDLLRVLGESVHGTPITFFPVIESGAARHMTPDQFHRHPIQESDYKCPGFEVIYHHDGRVLPCCSPGVFDTVLAIGTTSQTIEESIAAIEHNALLALIQREGLGWFLDRIRKYSPESHAAGLTEVVSACELCSVIFGDTALIRAIKPEVAAYFADLQAAHVRANDDSMV